MADRHASGTSDTAARILDGALLVLARCGRDKLSMSDVGAVSGMSRGTLYRYFRSKEDILTAIAGHVRAGLQQQLNAAVAKRPDLDNRIAVVAETLLSFARTRPEAGQVLSVEPDFGVEFVRDVFAEFVDFIEELLTPALDLTPPVRSGAMTSAELSELILRVVASAYFIPTRNSDDVRRALAALPCLRSVEVVNCRC